METNVSMLLREFPRIRRAALAGETVIIRTREGDLQLTAAPSRGRSLIGCLKGQVIGTDDKLDRPTTEDTDWGPSD